MGARTVLAGPMADVDMDEGHEAGQESGGADGEDLDMESLSGAEF